MTYEIYSKGRSKLICDNCKEEFIRWNSQIPLGKKHYCSRNCQYDDMKKGKFVKCNYCGNEIWKMPNELEKYKTHYCSYNCLHKDGFSKEHKKKLSKSHYKGGTGNKDRNQTYDWRNRIYKRDNYECQVCHDKGGKGRKVILNAHHIKSFAEYPNDRYRLSNGITLCTDCHKWVHRFCIGDQQ